MDAKANIRWLYLHGFASGPNSSKGRGVSEHFARLGVQIERLDLRVPSFERLSLGAMIDKTQRAIGTPSDRAIVFGSSLGGLTAARVAERDARVCALVLLAPAFRIAERWPDMMGKEKWDAWQREGWAEVDDYAENRKAKIHFDFIREARDIDSHNGGWPDVRVPTLILHGIQDDVVDINLSRQWSKGKPHVTLVELEDGHELTKSLPDIVSHAEKFLAGAWNGSGG